MDSLEEKDDVSYSVDLSFYGVLLFVSSEFERISRIPELKIDYIGTIN